MSEINTAKLNIESLTSFQKDLYYSDSQNDLSQKISNTVLIDEVKDVLIELADKNNSNQINSRFSHDMQKYAWGVHSKEVLKSYLGNNKDEIIYEVSSKYDTLFATEMHITLLPIRVKEEKRKTVEICYTHNPGHNIPYYAELKVDDDHLQTIDSVWMDINSQFYMKPGSGKYESYQKRIGNVSILLDWNTELPGFKLNVPQPFYYSKDTRIALKILRNSSSKITYHYNIKRDIKRFIRMRVRKSEHDEWKEIPCNMKYLEVKGGKDKLIPIPELWGRYSLMNDDERNWQIETLKMENAKMNTLYIEDIYREDTSDSKEVGTTVKVPIKSKYPCKALFWVAQNEKAKLTNNYSNYTTNLDDISFGWNPCGNLTINYGDSESESVPMSREHYEDSESWDFFPSSPQEYGYNAISYSFDQSTLNGDTSIILSPLNVSFNIKLDDKVPVQWFDDNEGQEDDGGEVPKEALEDDYLGRIKNKDKYYVYMRGLVSRKLTLSWENDKIKYTLENPDIK